jgi:pyrroloquinoline quinone (PQQ) biosynthesis protein C
MRFRESLLRVMDQKDHWAWPHFSGPAATRAQLLVHFQQEYLTYIRDFPRFLGRVHGQCPDPGARRLLAENLYEEETGGLSRTGPHPDLFIKMMRGLGFGRARFDRARLLPCAERYRRWLDLVTTRGDWVIAAAVITIFVEGSVKDRAVLSNRTGHGGPYLASKDPLAVHHGVHDSFLTLKHAHAKVENGHRDAAWRIVETHAIGLQARMRLIKAMKESLRLWLDYRDGVARAAGLVPRTAVH